MRPGVPSNPHVVQFFRRPGEGHFSIERVFTEVREHLPSDVKCRPLVLQFASRGVWRRLHNVVEAACRQGDVNHITGDIHYVALLLRGRRTLLTIHDCGGLKELTGLKRRLLWLFWFALPARRAAMVSVVSEATKRDVVQYVGCPPDKIRVIPNPVPTRLTFRPKEFDRRHPRILQVGTKANKNIPRVAEALRDLACHFRVIGRLSAVQRNALLSNRIEFSSVQNLSDKAMAREYEESDLVICASTNEGFGLPIIEANAVGRPVVAGRVASIPEAAGEAACLVDPYDPASIRQGVRRVIEDADYRNGLIRNGVINAKRFRPDMIAGQYAALYRELLSPRAVGRKKAAA